MEWSVVKYNRLEKLVGMGCLFVEKMWQREFAENIDSMENRDIEKFWKIGNMAWNGIVSFQDIFWRGNMEKTGISGKNMKKDQI